jgi:hypothetical protein
MYLFFGGGGGVEFFPLTPCSQVLSICAVACLKPVVYSIRPSYFLITVLTFDEQWNLRNSNFKFFSSLVYLFFGGGGAGVEFSPLTPCSQLLSICAVACLVSAYKFLHFTVCLELFSFCGALRPDTEFVRMLFDTLARTHTAVAFKRAACRLA